MPQTKQKEKKKTQQLPLVPDQNVHLGNKVGNQADPPVVPHGDQWCDHQPQAGTCTRTPRTTENILDVVGEDIVRLGEHHLEIEARAPDLGR